MEPDNRPDPLPQVAADSTDSPLLASSTKPLEITRYLNEGWRLFMTNPALSVGYTLLMIAIYWLLGYIPLIGTLAAALLSGPLMGGFYLALRKQLHNHPVQFGDYLAGFNNPVQLILVGLVGNVLITIGLVLLLLPGIYLAVAYLFAVLLVADRDLEFWPALEDSRKFITRQWFSFFVLALLLFLANAIGALLFGIGLLISIPFSVAVITVAYHHLIGLRAPA